MYRISRLLPGWSRAEILDTPAVELDWMLAIADTETAAQNSLAARGRRLATMKGGPR